MKVTKQYLQNLIREELGMLLTENEREVQDEYTASIVLNIQQSSDVDRTEVLAFIRAIPNVSTIRRVREISTSDSTYVGEFLIRLILKHGQSVTKYTDNVLKPEIRKIRGVSLQSLSNLEKVS
jgi:hypothetical protein